MQKQNTILTTKVLYVYFYKSVSLLHECTKQLRISLPQLKNLKFEKKPLGSSVNQYPQLSLRTLALLRPDEQLKV